MGKLICSKCNHEYGKKDKTCPNCMADVNVQDSVIDSTATISTPANSEMRFCRACGHVVHLSATDCPRCGAKQYPTNKLSKSMALLMCFFFGAFGGHRFYLGRPVSGVLYLLFFWTLIPPLIAFVEFFILLCSSEETINEKYGRK